MKRLSIYTLMAGLLATTPSLQAAEAGEAQLGGLIGFGSQSLEVDGTEIIDDNDLALGVRLSFFATDNIAFEAGYENFGKAEDSLSGPGGNADFEIESDAITLGAKFGGPIAHNVDAYARIGVAFWESDLEASVVIPGATVSDKASEDGEDLYFGAGATFDVAHNAFVGAEYTYFMLEPDDADLDVHRFAVMGGVRF